MKKPKISVIMGIYNCESTLASSLDSLLSQKYRNFEVIMCDDGSVDNTYYVAEQYCKQHPEQFFLFKNTKNMGLHHALNVCLQEARGEYIARMDGDDLSLPTRFQKQLTYLESNSDIAIVSTSMIHFDKNGDWGISKPKANPEERDFIFGSPFPHAPSLVRREAYEKVNGYSVHHQLLRVEDYHLWIKMYEAGYKGHNIQEPLYKMRDDQNAAKRRNFKSRLNEAYVKYVALRTFRLSPMYSIFILRPIIVSLLPKRVYSYLYKKSYFGFTKSQ